MKQPEVSEELNADNLKAFRSKAKSGSPLVEYTGLVALLADIADTAIGGLDCYATFGLSRDKSTILCTVTIGRQKLYAGGKTLIELSQSAESLL